MLKVISISGRTHTDKQEVLRALHDRLHDARIVLSDTTRDPRPTDIPHMRWHRSYSDYNYVRRTSPFLWSVHHAGQNYGTSAFALDCVFRKPNTVGLMNVMPDVVLELNRVVTERTGDPESHVAVFILSTGDKIMTRNRRFSGVRVGLIGEDRRPKTAVEEEYWYLLASLNAERVPTLFVRNNVTPERTAEVIIRRLGL